jgi:translation initiation factor 2 subunit 1
MIKRKGLPKQNELVLVTVNRVTPYAAWCNLDEFDGVEGMVHISEVAGKWIYNIKDFVKEGKQYVAKAVNVDEEKKQVKLSLKRVSKKDEKKKLNDYRKEVRAERTLEQVAKELGKTLEQAYDEIGYMLIDDFGGLNAAFEDINAEGTADIGKKWLDALIPVLQKLYKEKETEIKVGLFLASYEGDGIEKVKEILAGLQEAAKADVKYVPNYKDGYNYRLQITTKDPKNAEKKLKSVLDGVVQKVRPNGEGSYRLLK